MPRGLMIAGVGAESAAATVGCAVAFAMRARGMRVGAMKPVETRCVPRSDGVLEPPVARSLMLAASCTIPIEVVCPYRYVGESPPDAAAGPELARIVACFRRIDSESDAVIVDASRGLAAPIAAAIDHASLALTLRLQVLLVVARKKEPLGESILVGRDAISREVTLAGYIVADTTQDRPDITDDDTRALERLTGIPCLGRMRLREPLSKAIVERLL